VDEHVKWLIEQTLDETKRLSTKVDEMIASHQRVLATSQTILATVEKVNAVVRRQNDHGERLRVLEKKTHTIPPPRNRENSTINELTPEVMAALVAAREAHESQVRRSSWFYRKRWTVAFAAASFIASAAVGACAHALTPEIGKALIK